MFSGKVLLIIMGALALYVFGLFILMNRPHFIKKIIALEMLVGAVNLNVIAMGIHLSGDFTKIDPFAGIIIIFSTTIGGIIAAAAFALAYWTRLHFDTLDTNALSTLKR